MSLEDALEYIGDDELVELTPESIHLLKAILNETERKRAISRATIISGICGVGSSSRALFIF